MDIKDIAIALTAFGRPHYLRQTLKSLSNCSGIEHAHLVVSVDYNSNPETRAQVIDLVLGWDKSPIEISLRGSSIGCDSNTRAVMDQAFGCGREYVVLLEDDICVSPDFLYYHHWCSNYYQYDFNVLQVLAHSRSSHFVPELARSVCRRRGFSGLSWGTWKNRWNLIREPWSNVPSYDVFQWRRWMRENNYGWDACAIRPYLSRIQHIGAVGGTNVDSISRNEQNFLAPCWAGACEVIPHLETICRAQPWREVSQLIYGPPEGSKL